MRDKSCPHCGAKYTTEYMNGKPFMTCPACHTYFDFDERTYNYSEDSPKHIKDSFRALELVTQSPDAIVLSPVKPFYSQFRASDVMVLNPKDLRLTPDKIDSVHPSKFPIIGWRGCFAYGAYNVAQEALHNKTTLNPFTYPKDYNINQRLFIPVLTKAITKTTAYDRSISKAIDWYYRITLEAKIRTVFSVFRDGRLSPMCDEYLLLSHLLFNPEKEIGPVSSPEDIKEKTRKYIRKVVKVKDIKTENIRVPFDDQEMVKRYAHHFLEALPATAVNADEGIPHFDILNHTRYTFEYCEGDKKAGELVMGYMCLIHALCVTYMGSELCDYNLSAKRQLLMDNSVVAPDDAEKMLLTFWDFVDKTINGETAEDYEIN